MTVSRQQQQFRQSLHIDSDDIDGALERHAELYNDVCEQHAEAVARRDAVKLEYERAEARADREIRREAKAKKEKLFENQVTRQLKLDPHLMELEDELLKLRNEVNTLEARKTSFQQRSYMLRELVQWKIAHMRDLGLEHGLGQQRKEDTISRVGEARHRRRTGK